MNLLEKSIVYIIISLLPLTSFAQGFGMGGMGHGGGAKGQDDKEMVIKRAKDTPASGKNDSVDEKDDFLKKPPSFQLFNLNGYMRLRSQWYYRLDLGHHNFAGISSPFEAPLTAYSSKCGLPGAPGGCTDHSMTSTNMRLRLNPVLRPSDTVSIHSTVDIFDNLVLGSSPSGLSYGYGTASYMPYAGFDGTSAVYNSGTTSVWDSIRFKTLYGKWILNFLILSLVACRINLEWE